jgi:hypothetical protein
MKFLAMLPRLGFSRLLCYLSICAGFVLQASYHGVDAQFGIPTKPTEAYVGADGEVHLSREVTEIASALVTIDPTLKEQVAVDIASLIDAAKSDKDTKFMLQKMKTEEPEAVAGIASLAPLEIIKGLIQAFEEIKMLDYLFQDKERALLEMDKEGMIDKDKLPIYQKDPDLLEADTRKGLYFMFVALAEAAGFL